MDFLKLLEEYENYKRGFGIEPKSYGHSACVDFANWLNNNASQQSFVPDVAICEDCKKNPALEGCSVCAECGL